MEGLPYVVLAVFDLIHFLEYSGRFTYFFHNDSRTSKQKIMYYDNFSPKSPYRQMAVMCQDTVAKTNI